MDRHRVAVSRLVVKLVDERPVRLDLYLVRVKQTAVLHHVHIDPGLLIEVAVLVRPVHLIVGRPVDGNVERLAGHVCRTDCRMVNRWGRVAAHETILRGVRGKSNAATWQDHRKLYLRAWAADTRYHQQVQGTTSRFMDACKAAPEAHEERPGY